MIQNVQQTIQKLWQQLSWVQRFTIIGLSAATAAAIALLVAWANTPTYAVLFSNLSSQDASTIVTQLQSAKVPYQLANGGTTILVPQQMVDAERLQLAGQGLPQGGVVGFDLFDKSTPFQSDSFVERVNYTRALEGELTRTIGTINGVSSARVNIVIPEQQVFSEQQANPTASVLLKLDPGASLSGDQVTGIQHLVASAVQGLKAGDVTVVNSDGTILSGAGGADGLAAAGMTALQAQTRYASMLEAQLTAMLDTIVGPDKAVVRVNDVMDWSQRDAVSTTYAPKNNPIAEEHVITSTSKGTGSAVGGIVGIGSQTSSYGKNNTNASSTSQGQGDTHIINDVSSTVSHVIQPPGSVRQLSVAVVLNGVTNKAHLAQLRQAVIAAAGLNLSRGDQISISSMPFDTTVAKSAATAASAQQQQELIVTIVRWVSLIIVPLILLFALRRLLVPAVGAEEEDAEDVPGASVIEEGPALLETPGQTPLLSRAKEREKIEDSPARKSMVELAREKPDVVAGLIGRWIEEDR